MLGEPVCGRLCSGRRAFHSACRPGGAAVEAREGRPERPSSKPATKDRLQAPFGGHAANAQLDEKQIIANSHQRRYASSMLPRMAKTIVALAVLAGAGHCGFAAMLGQVSHPVDFNGGTASPEPWKYHEGDDANWASPDFDDSSWGTISMDKPWGGQRKFDTYGFSWYRVRIVPGASAPRTLAVLFPSVKDAYEVFWDGRLVGSYGSLPPHASWYNNQWPETFGLGISHEGVLAVRVWKAPSWLLGSGVEFVFPPVLGSPESIAQAKGALDFAWLRSLQFAFGSISLMALIFTIGIIGWLRDRKQWVLLWMAFFAFIPCGALLIFILKTLREPLQTGLFSLVTAAGDVSIILLLLWLLDLKSDRKLLQTAYRLCVVTSLAGILKALCLFGFTFQNPGPALIGFTILLSITLAIELFPVYLIAIALRRPRSLDRSRWMVALSSLLVLLITTLGGILAIVGQFFHRDLGGVIWTPIAVVLGNPIMPLFVAFPICLLTVFYAVYRYSSVNRRRQIALEEEFKSAREIQSVLIPETLPSIPGIEVTSAYKPVREVGGDFFQVLSLDGGATMIVIGDVSGKGLKAAMAVSLIVGMLRALVQTTTNPAQLIAALNRSVLGQLQGGFATCIVLRIDTAGRCVFANAGHPAPFLNGHEVSTMGALPIGITSEAEYAETVLDLSPGDRLTLFSDGLLEARNTAGDLYGFKRLESLLSANPNAADAAEAAIAFGQDDDITVLTLTRRPVTVANTSDLATI